MATAVFSFLAGIGGTVLSLLRETGVLFLFTMRAVALAFQPPFFAGEILRQFIRIGYYSLPVVGLTALFTGAVLALQIYIGGSRFNAESGVPSIVAISIVRELGPVIGCLMVAGRVSAAIAAEIATMRVTEQIDALVTLSTNPLKYLVAPRLIAATIAMPLLVGAADSIGILGGYLVGVTRLDFNGAIYIQNTVNFLLWEDIASGLWKAAVFGFIIALMGCFHGYYSNRGAQGVGRATTQAVVSASVLILASNYVLTELLFTD